MNRLCAPIIVFPGISLFQYYGFRKFLRRESFPYWASVNHIIVIQEGSKPVILSVDLKAPPLPKPELGQPQTAIKQGDSNIFTFKGKNFNSLSAIRFEGTELEFTPKASGAELEIRLTTEITALSGTKRLEYKLRDGKTGSFTITVN